MFVEYPKEFAPTHKLLQLRCEFSMSRYRVNMQKSIVFPYASND